MGSSLSHVVCYTGWGGKGLGSQVYHVVIQTGVARA